jgi:hypothetical protein
MAKQPTMRALGRRGGLLGGPARARNLDAHRRSEIAKGAAEARWKPTILELGRPNNLGELRCFVAQYGNGHARAKNCDPVGVLLRAISACRNDAGLARMIPVFVHRARIEIFDDPRRLLTASPEESCALGYFLELTCRLGELDEPHDVLHGLRRKSQLVKEPVVLFRNELAAKRTSLLARSWKLVLGEPDDSFESYFQKTLGVNRPVFRRMPMLGKGNHAPL